MSFQCLRPKLAIQKAEGEKPIFLRMNKDYDFEWFLRNISSDYKLLLIPCGSCVNCVKRKSQEWTSRLLKEMSNYKYCYFITLTYNDENLRDINKRDLQLFLKRYRKAFNLSSKFECKYYITGEYGEVSGRPHYHAIFYQNKPIKDLRFYANNLYISKVFSDIWKNGNCLISKEVNERDVKYTVAYTNKKIGENKLVLMSKGIGLQYLKDKKEDIKKHEGFYTVNGYKQSLPSYFRRKLKESTDQADIQYLKDKENEMKPSRLVSGRTIGDLLHQFFESLEVDHLKGKGEF